MKKPLICALCNNKRGVSAVWVAILLVVFMGFVALAIDIGYLKVVRNELNNAADAAALAGARQLYYEPGGLHGGEVNAGQDTTIYPDSANRIAYITAIPNKAQGVTVDINYDHTLPYPEKDNNNDIQRGHWSFGMGSLDKGFTANDSVEPIEIANFSELELDQNPNYINAVKVVTHRQKTGTPVNSFFGRIFGFTYYELSASAVAYIGFVGSMMPDDIDVPIVMCYQSLFNDTNGNGELDPNEKLECNYARMQNSDSKSDDDTNTGGWSDFSQDPCDQTNANEMKDILSDCSTGNPNPIIFNEGIGATGGVQDNIFGSQHETGQPDSLFNCWKNGLWDGNEDGDFDDGGSDELGDHAIDEDGDGWPEYPWAVTVPVIDCGESNNVQKCSKVLGAVTVYIIWLQEKDNSTALATETPLKMYNPVKGGWWYASTTDETEAAGIQRWNEFVADFNLVTSATNQLATYENDGFKKKTIYFMPACKFNTGAGTTGGHNFGIQAEIPVLVE